MAMPSTNSLILGAALLGAALFAVLRKEPSRTTSNFEPRPTQNEAFDPSMLDEADDDQLPPNHPAIGGTDELPPNHPAIGGKDELPSNHPPIAGTDTPGDLGQSADDGAQALSWKAPSTWSKAPNTNAMRLATYRVPAAAGARNEAELTVVRAGGSTEANLQRWIGQFDNPEVVVRDKRIVNGLAISTLEVRGTFHGGGMAATGPAESKPGWTLKGAVVETAEGPYFFKLTGPTPSVVAARAGFDQLVNSVAPVSKSAAQ